MLWDAACSIRGEKDAPKFKDYLLPLLFLKRLSDVFDDEIDRLAVSSATGTIALEIAEADHSLSASTCRRGAVGRDQRDEPSTVADGRARPATAPRDIGEHLTKAVRAVVRHEPSLSGRDRRRRLRRRAQTASATSTPRSCAVWSRRSRTRATGLGLADVQPDFLGRAYEYLLGSSPRLRARARRVLHADRGRLADGPHPAPEARRDLPRLRCGSAGLLIKLPARRARARPDEQGATADVRPGASGRELRGCRMNSIIHDMDVDLERGDTIINPKFNDG
jgi:type I restriction enzyme M protein